MDQKTKKPLIDEQIEAIAEAQEISVNQAANQFIKRSKHVINLDQLSPQVHTWTDRGAKYTCENSGHPYHEVWKRR